MKDSLLLAPHDKVAWRFTYTPVVVEVMLLALQVPFKLLGLALLMVKLPLPLPVPPGPPEPELPLLPLLAEELPPPQAAKAKDRARPLNTFVKTRIFHSFV